MDPFTENILSRARERQRMLGEGKVMPLQESNKNAVSEPNLTEIKHISPKAVLSESNLTKCVSTNEDKALGIINCSNTPFSRQNSITRISSNIEGSPNTVQTKTLNIQREDFNMEIKVKSADNVHVQVEIEERENNDNYNDGRAIIHHTQENGLREESKNRLKRLGKLYAGGDEPDISSPIHRTEAQFYSKIANDEENPINNQRNAPISRKGLSKLADLADSINQWEDDLSHSTHLTKAVPKKTWKPPAPQPPVNKQPSTPQKPTLTKSTKPRAPSPPVVKNLSPKKALPIQEESNGRKAIDVEKSNISTSPKKTNFNSSVKDVGKGAIPKQINWDPKVLNTLEHGSKSEHSKPKLQNSDQTIVEETEQQINKTDNQRNQVASVKKTDDKAKSVKPGSIANRAAMFESKVKVNPTKSDKDPALLSIAERKALFEKNKGDALVPKAAFGMSAAVKVDTTMKASESKFIGLTSKAVSSVSNSNLSEGTNNIKVSQKVVQLKENNTTPNNGITNKSTVNSALSMKSDNNCNGKSATNLPTVAQVHQADGIANKMAALLGNKSTISEEQIFKKMKEERQKEMDMLLNRFNRNKEVSAQQDLIEQAPSDSEDYSEDESADENTRMLKDKPAKVITGTPRRSAEKRKSGGRISSADSDSPHVVSVLEDVKRIKVSPPKAGQLYPNLSDIETVTTDADTRTPTPNQENSFMENSFDSGDPNTSFGRDILEAVCKNITPTRKVAYAEPSSSESSSLMGELDEIPEEIYEDGSSYGPTPPKQGRHGSPKHSKAHQSNSFHYKSFTTSPSQQKSKFQSPKRVIDSPRQSTDLPLVVDGEQVLTLTHTVSFYRKQQNEVHTPVRQISRQPMIEESSETESCNEDEAVEEKISFLEGEVNKQQNIIAQTSQALNLCSSTLEFSGSTEQVEAEKVLLVASHRRQAALHELQRLRVERSLRPISKLSKTVPLEKGTLTISNIVLPMKQKYVTALAATGGKGHHVVCLIKCGEQVVPTKLISTVASKSKNPDTDLYIPGSVTLNNIYSDFTVTFEVYCLQAQEEFLPHEVKYHINKKTSKNLVTPKKNKQDNRLVRPPKESPAGPNVVRSSTFALMGYVVFSVQALNKKTWSLNNTPPMSPLEGSVEMKINCDLAVSVEHRGFLTMFEDISGFGAWHRRWCLLKGHELSYWKYPDDEKKQAPIDTIDLKTSVTKNVAPVSREICARLHTFLLEREREAYPTDKDTLVIIRKGSKTIIRHLLSADTKEERIEWCHKLNAALTAIRMWGKD
ncbi:anillin, actin binding protein isoform X2 [Rhynchophorus ferrugineus]|uniref:anillin, actin binding protein isoform X2 n=1 Tax=Rhynchophorus ferrugineus TaxID=354439 RepID=UPI003FCD8E28